jgi:hypothetical protein
MFLKKTLQHSSADLAGESLKKLENKPGELCSSQLVKAEL